MLTTRADDLAIPFSKSHPVDKARKPKALHVVGNLPFGVATPLLLSWLHALRETDDLFVLAPPGSLTLMFQKEVAKRIVSPIKCKERGRLSVMTQAVCHARISYNVPARIFVPAPDVDAAVVHLIPRGDGPEKILHGSYTLLEDLVRYCFSKRRKTLGHTLK
jgi:dimethyladenosine transferase 1